MKRAYLEEDLSLIQKYFPGARSIALRTPFDITDKPARLPRLPMSTFRDTAASSEEVVWIH